MASVELSDNEWTQVIGFMSYAPARDCMPLINKIGAQITQQHLRQTPDPNVNIAAERANGQEVRRE